MRYFMLSSPAQYPLRDQGTRQHCVFCFRNTFRIVLLSYQQIATDSKDHLQLFSGWHGFFLRLVGSPHTAATMGMQALACTRASHLRGTIQMLIRPSKDLSAYSHSHTYPLCHTHTVMHTPHPFTLIHKHMHTHRLRDHSATHIDLHSCSHTFAHFLMTEQQSIFLQHDIGFHDCIEEGTPL